MREAAADLEFEEAARLRDEIKRLQDHELGLDKPGMPTGGAPGGAGGFAERIAHAGAASKSRQGKYARARGERRLETCRGPEPEPDIGTGSRRDQWVGKVKFPRSAYHSQNQVNVQHSH